MKPNKESPSVSSANSFNECLCRSVSSFEACPHYLSGGGAAFGERAAHTPPPRRGNQTDLVKRRDIPINMAVPMVHPAAGDDTQIGTAQQFTGINKDLIVKGLEVWSEENKDEVLWGVRRLFNSRLGNESLGVEQNFL